MYCDRSYIKDLPDNLIVSPNYPQSYPSNTNKTYNLEVAPGNRIKISFIVFNIDYRMCPTFDESEPCSCNDDYLKIVDGDGTLLFKQCGDNPRKPVLSSSNKVYVNFISGPTHSDSFSGFKINWEKVSGGSTSAATTRRPRVDGGWSAWSRWSSCSNNRGARSRCSRTRSRTCSRPAPANGGRQCSGSSSGQENCNINSKYCLYQPDL